MQPKPQLWPDGVLISILLVSFMVLMFRKGGRISSEYDSQQSANDLASFNSQFEAYDRNNNTILDVITVSNLAYDINKKNGFDAQNTVKVHIKIGSKKYEILADANLKKNYFVDGTYMYDLVNAYNEIREKPDGSVQYQYTFDCKDESDNPGMKYNRTTGKVSEIYFKMSKNF